MSSDSDKPRREPQHRREEATRRRSGDRELAGERSEVKRLQGLLDRQAEQLSSAHHALDLRDEFFAIVSHDLRNPLNAIALNTQLLERLVASGDPRLTRISGSLAASIAQMSRIISDLLDLAAIEAGKFSVQPQPGDARKLIGDAVESSRPVAAQRSIMLDAAVGPDPLRALFDPVRIGQVLQNLIDNALKFTPDGGRISVGGRRSDGVVEIRVRNTGPGLQPEEIAVIFERFRQVEKRGRRALGLGLYIARSIVESHGGRIWAESVPGEGSTFLFNLPEA